MSLFSNPKEDNEYLLSQEEFSIIEQVRKLRPFDKIIIAKNQSGTRITTTLIRQDQMTFEISK